MGKKKDKLIDRVITLFDEKWADLYLDGDKTKYRISSHGRVLNSIRKRYLAINQKNDGYLRVSLVHNGKGYSRLVHVLVATAFIPNPKDKPEVNHKDCDKGNCYEWNLEWVTRSENMKHAIANGVFMVKSGTDHGNSIHSEETIHKVCKLLEKGHHPKYISVVLGVPIQLPGSIKYYGNWSHISSQYKIPKSGELPKGPRQNPEKSKLFTHEHIRQICELLEEGLGPTEISNLLETSINLVSDIKNKRSWKLISDQYDLPPPIKKSPVELIQQAKELLLNEKHKYEEILDILGLADTKKNRQRLANIKQRLKETGSTTIEKTKAEEKDPVIGK